MRKLLSKGITDNDVKNSLKAMEKLKKIIKCNVLTDKSAREAEQSESVALLLKQCSKNIRKISNFSMAIHLTELFQDKNILPITIINKDIKQLMKLEFIKKEYSDYYEEILNSLK